MTVYVRSAVFDKKFKAWNISWDCGDQETIDYYKFQLNSDTPMLLKNSSAQVVILDTSRNHTAYIRAVDRCNQEGPIFPHQLSLKQPLATSAPVDVTMMADSKLEDSSTSASKDKV